MKSTEAKLIRKVFYSNSTATNEEIDEAYSYIPNKSPLEVPRIYKIQAINRYGTFNNDELEYAIANSDDVLLEIQEHIFNMETPTIEDLIYEDMPTELVNNQSPDNKLAKEPGYVLPKPAVKAKGKRGRPKAKSS